MNVGVEVQVLANEGSGSGHYQPPARGPSSAPLLTQSTHYRVITAIATQVLSDCGTGGRFSLSIDVASLV